MTPRLRVNGDSKLDAVFASGTSQRSRVCLGDGLGGFTCSDVSTDVINTAAVALTPPDPEIEVPFDIKPQSCPNPLNVKLKGVLRVAILGTDDFDVTEVDPESVMLAGVEPLRWGLEDVGTPIEPFTGKDDCFADCTNDGPDGILDLTLKYDRQEVVAAIGGVTDGECLVLLLPERHMMARPSWVRK